MGDAQWRSQHDGHVLPDRSPQAPRNYWVRRNTTLGTGRWDVPVKGAHQTCAQRDFMCQDGRQHVRQALRNTDPYMDLFVDELNHAYVSGAWMWDAHLKETFLFKAKLYATVCDWPGCQTRKPCAAQQHHTMQDFARCMVSCITAARGLVSAAKCVANTSADCIGWCNRSTLVTISG